MTDENPPTFQELMTPISTAITNSLQGSRQYYIPTFSGSNTEDPVRFMRNFKRIADALSWNDEQKLLKFPTYLSGDAETFYYVNVDIVPEDKKPSNFKILEELFTNHFSRGDYKSHLMQTLYERKQKPGESLVTFITNIRAICWDIDPEWDEKRVINYMYNGMNKQAAKDIILMNPKTIKELIEFAKRVDHAHGYERNYEDEKKSKNKIIGTIGTPNGNKFIKTENSTLKNDLNEKFDQLHKMMMSLMKNNNENFNSNRNSQGRRNFRENFRENFRGNFRQTRPKFGNSNLNSNYRNTNQNRQIYPCHGCGQFGHYIRNCQNKRYENNNTKQENMQVKNESKSNQNQNPKNINYINSNDNKVLSITNEEKNLIFIDVKINDKKQLKALIDCGAEISLIKHEIAKELNLNIMKYNGVDIVNVSGESLNPLGLTEVTITLKLIDGTFANLKFVLIVVEKLPTDILLGNNFNAISNLTIKCKKKKVKCNGKLVVDMTENYNKLLGNIHCNKKTRIPKRTLALIDVNSDKQLIKKNKSLFIYANDQLYNQTRINVKNIILKPQKSVAMLQVANLNNFDVELKKGTILAKYEIINDEDVIEFDFYEKDLKKMEIDCITKNESQFNEEFEENDFEDKIETEIIELFNGEINIEKSFRIQKKIKQPFKSSRIPNKEIENKIHYKIVSESESESDSESSSESDSESSSESDSESSSESNSNESPKENTIINDPPINNSRIEIDLDARTESSQSESEQSSEEPSLNETVYESDNLQSSSDDGEEQIPRRSTRIRRPIDKWNYTMMIVCIICFITNQVFGLSERDPIIWRRTDRKVVEGSIGVSLIIDFQSPCSVFKRFDHLIDEDIMNELSEWCNDLFENDFMKPLRKQCKRIDILEENRVTRGKRFAIMGIVIGVTIVVAVIVGITSTAIIRTDQAKKERIKMQKEIDNAYQEIEKLKETRELEIKAIQTLNNILMNLTSQVHEIEVDYNKFKKQTPTTMKLIAFLTTKFHYIKSVLKQTKRMTDKKKFNSEFLEIFNATIECEEEKCPSDYWTYQSCRLDDIRKIIEVKFNMKMISNEFHVIKADPFDLIKVKEKSNGFILCHSQYNGPKAVLYADKLGCVIPYKIWNVNENEYEYENINLVQEKIECDPEFIDAGKKNLFGLKNCEETERFEPTEIIQIKQLGEFNYIYCTSFNITIYKKTIVCPDFVFAVNLNESFQIGDLKYDAKQIKHSLEVTFDPGWSNTINHQLNPHMKSNILNEYFGKIEETIDEMNAILFKDNVPLISVIFGKNYMLIGIICFVILCVSIICFYRCFKCFKQWEIRKKESEKENSIELRKKIDNLNKGRLEEVMSVEQQLECNRKLYRKKKPRFNEEKVTVHDPLSA